MSCSKCSPTKACSGCKPQRSNMKQLKEAMKIKKMLIETMRHDRRTCKCKACWHFAMGFTVMKNLRFYRVVGGWKVLDRDEYLRAFQRILSYKMDKKTTTKKLAKFLKFKGAPERAIPEIVEQMQSAIFVVMFKASPMGMLREI